MKIKDQGHLLTLVQGHSYSTFSNFSFQAARPIEAKFQMGPPWDRGTKVYSVGPGHTTKRLPCPYILNQIPNATRNTFLNNSKPTECRLMPFKPWLDKCVRHSIFEFERSALFHARAFAFCLMVPPFEKVTKKKAENSLLQFCFTLCKCFVFVICSILRLKVVKSIKIGQNLLTNGQSHDAENKRSEHFVSQWTDTIQFTL